MSAVKDIRTFVSIYHHRYEWIFKYKPHDECAWGTRHGASHVLILDGGDLAIGDLAIGELLSSASKYFLTTGGT